MRLEPRIRRGADGRPLPSMVEAAQALFPGETIVLVLGGFRLVEEDEVTLRTTAQRLRELGVVRLASTHCSGDLARCVP